MEHRTGRLASMAALLASGAPADDVEQVPDDLQKLAKLKLREAAMHRDTEARVNPRGNHPLAKWSRDRKAEKRKAKIAAASRRRNRK